METQNNTEIKYKHYCDLCNVGANSYSVWLKHLNSKKHQRGGLKPKICNIYNLKFYNHWNLKQYYILIHATIEEKKNVNTIVDIVMLYFYRNYIMKIIFKLIALLYQIHFLL